MNRADIVAVVGLSVMLIYMPVSLFFLWRRIRDNLHDRSHR